MDFYLDWNPSLKLNLLFQFTNTFKKLENFERSLDFQIDILNKDLWEYLPSYALLKIWNNLSLDLKRSASRGSQIKRLFIRNAILIKHKKINIIFLYNACLILYIPILKTKLIYVFIPW